MLDQPRRRLANIKPALGRRIVFAGRGSFDPASNDIMYNALYYVV